MRDRIGFDRVVKLDWLNKTAEFYMEERDYGKVKLALDKYLEHLGRENRRKTIYILVRTWVNVESEHKHIRDKAIKLFEMADEDEKVAIHWCMLMMAYPIFLDITATIGKLLDLQDGFSLSMVRRRIYELWGERSTLQYALNKIVRSITEWGAIEDGCKLGDYKRKEQFIINNIKVKLLLIEAYLASSGKAYLRFGEVNNLDELFPFKMDLELDDFHSYQVFNLNKMGSDVVITL